MDMPVKSHFDQVRRASGLDGLNLLKSPAFFVKYPHTKYGASEMQCNT